MQHLQTTCRTLLIVVILARVAAAQEIAFRDDFNGTALQAGWTVIRPDASTYSLTANPGFFRVLTLRGLLGAEGTARNLLVRPASGDFIIDTRLEFDPSDGQPFAGLLVYQDDAHAVALGLVFASGDRGEFRGVVMLNVGDEVDPSIRPAARYDETNSSNPEVVYLRILRQGNQYVGAYSSDGVTFRDVGTVSNALNQNLSVGIGAANGDSESCGSECDVSIPALFDYFQISELGDDGPPVQGDLESVDIQGPEAVVGGGSASFQAIAHYSDGSTEDVSDLAEWIVAPTETGSISDGVLSAERVSSDRMATVVATYSQQGQSGLISRTDAVLVRIKARSSGNGGRVCGLGLLGILPAMVLPLAFAKARKVRQKLLNSRQC